MDNFAEGAQDSRIVLPNGQQRLIELLEALPTPPLSPHRRFLPPAGTESPAQPHLSKSSIR